MVNDKKNILEEIKNLLGNKFEGNDCVSLYEVSNILRDMGLEYERFKNKYIKIFNDALSKDLDVGIYLYDFNYDKNELRLGFHLYDDYSTIIFSKKDNDIYIKDTNNRYANTLLYILGDDLSILYDEFLRYEDFIKQSDYRINSVNSNFLVSMSRFGVKFFVDTGDRFELNSLSYMDKYSIESNQESIVSILKGNEEELFKRIYVKIDDCLEWMKPIIYNKKDLKKLTK